MLTTHKRRPAAIDADYLLPGDPPSKRQILESALHLFVRHGIDAVTVRDIGAEAGYTNAALFKFFPTKDALALYLFERCYLALFEALSASVPAGASFEDRFHALTTTSLSCMDRDLDAFLFVQDQLRPLWRRTSPAVRKRSILGLLRTLLEQGISEGKIRPTSDITLQIAVISGTFQQFARMLSFGEFPGAASDYAAELEETLLRSIAPDLKPAR
jgi:AcrR family transcriptional regulator